MSVSILQRLQLKPWQRTLYIVVGGQLVVLMGSSVAIPFLPFFIQDLGVTGIKQVALWTGLINSVAPLAQAAAAPVWGLLADRFGRKPMLVRSLIASGVMYVVIGAFVRTVPQLAILRVIQMALSGSQTAATIMIATTVPKEETGFSLGLVQTAGFLGHSLGPMLGGVIAATLGYRWAFIGAGVLAIAMGIVNMVAVQEKFTAPEHSRKRRGPSRSGYAIILGTPLLLSMVGLQFFNNVSTSVTRPMIPLFIQSITATTSAAAAATGMVVGGQSIANAIAAVTLGRLADRLGRRLVLISCVMLNSLLHFPQMFVTSPTQLLVLRFLGGLAAGGILPVGNAIIAETVPDARKGSVFGVSSSLNSFGRALGPMLGTLVVSTWSVAGVFPVTGAMLALNAITVTFTSRVMRDTPARGPQALAPVPAHADSSPEADGH